MLECCNHRNGNTLITAEAGASRRVSLNGSARGLTHFPDPRAKFSDCRLCCFQAQCAGVLVPHLLPARDVRILVAGHPAAEADPNQLFRRQNLTHGPIPRAIVQRLAPALRAMSTINSVVSAMTGRLRNAISTNRPNTLREGRSFSCRCSNGTVAMC